MNTRIMALIGAAAVLATGIGQAGAQQSSAGSTMQQGQQGNMMQQGASDQTGPGMRGQGMRGMMERGMMGRMGRHMGGHRGGRMGHGAMLPFLFAIMDADGDGALTLEEVQEIHARIFRHVDADDDGKVTEAEIRAFFQRGADASEE